MGGEFVVQPEEQFTEEDCIEISDMFWNTPGMLAGDHLTPDPVHVTKFGKALYKYCVKKNIDPNDFIFDEMPLLITGGKIATSMWRAHKSHKGDDKLYKQSNPDKPERKLGKSSKTGNDDGVIHHEHNEYSDEDRQPKQETTEYAPNETPHETVPENEYGEDSLDLSRL